MTTQKAKSLSIWREKLAGVTPEQATEAALRLIAAELEELDALDQHFNVRNALLILDYPAPGLARAEDWLFPAIAP